MTKQKNPRIKYSKPFAQILNKATDISKYHNKRITGKEEFLQALTKNQDSLAFKVHDYLKNKYNIDIVSMYPVANPVGFTPEFLSALSKSKEYITEDNYPFIRSEHMLMAMAEMGIIDVNIEMIDEALFQIKHKGYVPN